MSASAIKILEQFRKLPPAERRELVQAMLQEADGSGSPPPRRRALDQVLGKFTPAPDPEAKSHDRWFAEAIVASKSGEQDQ